MENNVSSNFDCSSGVVCVGDPDEVFLCISGIAQKVACFAMSIKFGKVGRKHA